MSFIKSGLAYKPSFWRYLSQMSAICLFGILAQAQSAQINTKQSIIDLPDAPFQFNGLLTLGTSRTLETFEGEDDSVVSSLISLRTTYKPQQLSIEAKTGWNQHLAYQDQAGQSGDWVNPTININKSFRFAPKAFIRKLTLGLQNQFGVNKVSKLKSFIWSSGPSISFKEVWSDFDFTQKVTYLFQNYEFDTRSNGRYNIKDTLTVSQGINYLPSDFTSVFLVPGIRLQTDFSGQTYQSYFWDVGFDYTMLSRVTLTLGLNSESGPYEPEGVSTVEARIFNPNQLSGYFDMGVEF